MAKNFAVLLVLLLCDYASSARKTKTGLRSGTRSVRRPNIIFILLDDMDKELGSPNVMKKTQKILREEGADFVNAFVTTPMCCPSRSSILTGKYAHNHHTFTNNWNCSSPSWRKGPERKSYARYLELAGYVTGHFGKYLNEYDGSWVPVGWKRWEGLLHNSKFYNYTIRHNTYKERHKMSYEQDYFTDLITNRSISFIRRTKASRPNSPFLAVVSHAAPHGPETAAPQYNTAFPDAKAPRFPNWNFISKDKQWVLREKQPMDAQKIAFVDLLHRRRLQTLLSVDDSVARIFNTLQSLGIENETYIVFTSDHGYHLGQFGLVKGKSMPFESDIRVPFYVRGPIIPKNIRVKEMVLNIDIAPTFLDIAGVNVPKDMDGSSVMRLFRKSRDGRRSKRKENVKWRDTILIERSRGWRRTKSLVAANSQNKYIPQGKSRNKTQTGKERKTTMLGKICSRAKHQSPCQPQQLWACVNVDGRPRLRKCRKTGAVQATTSPTTRPTPSTIPTTPVKMCICMKPRPGTEMNENQGDMLPYRDELLGSDFDYLSTKELRRRSKRSHFSFNDRQRRNRNEFNPRRYYKELARAQRLQNRRAKSKLLLRTPLIGTKQKLNETESRAGTHHNAGVQEVVEEKLGKLKEKIWETRMRLEALRDRRKKLLLISARDRLIEYPCPCNSDNGTKPEIMTTESTRNGGEESQMSPIKKRNKQPKAISRKQEPKKKKVKTSIRRTKCSTPGMNCFYQTEDHWKLPPFWRGGEFCFCPNAANNSYWCLRTINATHNFLYCEFITHFLEFFDLNQDPYQLYNVIHEVNPAVLSELHQQLNRMRDCKGEDCNHYHGKKYVEFNTTSAPLTTSQSPSLSTFAVAATSELSEGVSIATNKDVAVFNKTIAIHLSTVPVVQTSQKPSSIPLTLKSRSEDLANRREGLVSTSESALNSSETTESSEISPFTTLAPTDVRVEGEKRLKTKPTAKRGKKRTANTQKNLKKSKKAKKKFTIKEGAPLTTKSAVPLTSKSRSEGLGNSTESVVSTPEAVVVTSEAIKTSPYVFPLTTVASTDARLKTEELLKRTKKNLPFTTSAPTKAMTGEQRKPTERKKSKRRKSKTTTEKGEKEDEKETQRSLKKSKKSKKKSSAKKGLPFPTQTTTTPWNISYQFSKSAKNKKTGKDRIIHSNAEKPTESAVTLTTGSDDVPTVFLKTSERVPSSLKAGFSTLVPTSLTTFSSEQNTREMNLREHLTMKPTRRRSTKRRKNGEKEGKETPRKSKKLRKNKKKSSGKGSSVTHSNTTSLIEREDVSKFLENQTKIDPTSETERPESGKVQEGEEANQPLTEISRRRTKKPSGKRLNRNSKRRSKKPTKRPKPSQISEGELAEGGSVSPMEREDGFSNEQTLSPSDP